MKQLIKLSLLLTVPLFLSQCGINKQVRQAKGLSKSKYAIRSADSITIAGYDVREFKDIRGFDDVNPLSYPRIAAGLLSRDIPFRANLNVEITNPTSEVAAINQFDYRLLLAGNELATGIVDRRVEVPAGGKILVPIPVNANAYAMIGNSSLRNAFVNLVRSLAGSDQVAPSRVTLKIRPTLLIGNKEVKYPGYIDIDKEITSDLVTGRVR